LEITHLWIPWKALVVDYSPLDSLEGIGCDRSSKLFSSLSLRINLFKYVLGFQELKGRKKTRPQAKKMLKVNTEI